MVESQILELLLRYFKDYGYYIIFLALLLENFFITGLVIPGETVLLIGSAFAGQGILNIFLVIIIAISAAILGNIIGFLIGLYGGRPLVENFGKRIVSEEKIKNSEEFFDKHGPKAIIIGRFTAGVRVFVPLLAGAAKMNFLKFLSYTVLAVFAWTIILGLAGYFFGQNWLLIKKVFSNFTVAVLVVVVLAIIYFIIRRKRETANHSKDS